MIALLRRHRPLQLLWCGETISQLGTSVTAVALPLVAVSVLHATALMVSLLSAAAWLPWLLIGLPAGALIDQVRARRRLMIVCDLTAAAVFASVPVARSLHALTDAQLVAVALLAGAVSVVFTTTYQVYVRDIVHGESDRATANGVLQGSASAARIAGPGLAGLLAQLLGAAPALLADSTSFAVSAGCLLAVRGQNDTSPRPTSSAPLHRRIAEGLSCLRSDPLLRAFAFFGGASNLALTAYQSILVVFLVRVAHLRPTSVGLVLGLIGLGGVSGAVLARPLAQRVGSARAVLLSKTIGGAGALLIPLATTGPGAAFVISGGVIVGAGIIAGNILTTTFIQSYAPPATYARIAATGGVINYGTMPVGALLGGALASILGLSSGMWATTALVPLASLFLWVSPLRQMRQLPTPHPPPSPAPPLSVKSEWASCPRTVERQGIR